MTDGLTCPLGEVVCDSVCPISGDSLRGMYSYEERIRAVELYVEFGKRAVATIRCLGYPREKAIKA